MVVVCLAFGGVAYAAPVVQRIDVRGVHRIDADVVRMHVGSQVGKPLDAEQLRRDVRELWRTGAFTDVRVDTEELSSGVVLAFDVDEQPTVRKVLIAGNQDLELDKIDEVLDIKRDLPVDQAQLRRNREKIEELYNEHGYYLATVDVATVSIGTDQLDVRYTIDEHAKIEVRNVDFIGNRALSTEELRNAISTKRPDALAFMNNSGVYRRDALERDIMILTARYLDAGYATVKIGAPAYRLSRDKKFMHVAITIDEGPQYSFGSVDLRGELLGAQTQLRERMLSKAGTTFSRVQVERDREALEAYYGDQGYAHVNVVPRMKLDPTAHQVVLAFEIQPGKKTFVERIHVRGNGKTRDKVIRRELALSEGDLFRSSKLDKSKRQIFALGYFEDVQISSSRGSSDEFVDLNVEVRERQTGQLQVGAGFSSTENFIFQGQAAYDNFLGRGQSISFMAQISSVRRQFSLRFVEPQLLDTQWLFAAEAYNMSRGYGTFSRDATGAALTWGYPLADHLRASLTYRLEDVGITSGSGGIANFGARTEQIPLIDTANLLRGGLNSSVRATLGWESRNNRLLPTSGWYATAYAEYAGRLTGSENDFVRWGGFVRHYHHLGGPFTLRLNGEFGVTTSLDGKGVPLSERYLLGGIYDIRGYQPRSIGPQLFGQHPGDPTAALDPLPLGGNVELIGNAEIEFPLVKKLGISGVAFFDIGNAYNLEDRFCSRGPGSSVAHSVDACVDAPGMLTGLRKSVGLGVRWLSPIGPLRFEWGIPLDLKPGEKPSGLDFTIGTSF